MPTFRPTKSSSWLALVVTSLILCCLSDKTNAWIGDNLDLYYCAENFGDRLYEYTFVVRVNARQEANYNPFSTGYASEIFFGVLPDENWLNENYPGSNPGEDGLLGWVNSTLPPPPFTEFRKEMATPTLDGAKIPRLGPAGTQWVPEHNTDTLVWKGIAEESIGDGDLFWQFSWNGQALDPKIAIMECTEAPSSAPTQTPSSVPSSVPSDEPSLVPSSLPSDLPSLVPSAVPSPVPSVSGAPSSTPSSQPSDLPSNIPSTLPSSAPSVSGAPSSTPSLEPSTAPSTSTAPSMRPSVLPTLQDLWMESTVIGLTDSVVTVDLSSLANNDDTNELQDLAFDVDTKELKITQSDVTAIDLSSLDKPFQDLTFDPNTKRLGMSNSSRGVDLSEAFQEKQGPQYLSIKENILTLSNETATSEDTTDKGSGGGGKSNDDKKEIRKLNAEGGGDGGAGVQPDPVVTDPGSPDPVVPGEAAENSVDLSFLRVVHLQGYLTNIDSGGLGDPTVKYGGGDGALFGWPVGSNGRLLGLSISANGALLQGEIVLQVVDCTDPAAVVALEDEQNNIAELNVRRRHGRMRTKKFDQHIPIFEGTALCVEVTRNRNVQSDVQSNVASILLLIEQW